MSETDDDVPMDGGAGARAGEDETEDDGKEVTDSGDETEDNAAKDDDEDGDDDDEDGDNGTNGIDLGSQRVLRGQRVIRVRDLNPFLVCKLCGGYFRDCHTIPNCVHSFCKVCLFQWFETSSRCPTCNEDVGAQPRTHVLPDHTLQAITDCVHPDLKAADDEAEAEFYSRTNTLQRQDSTTSTSSRKLTTTEQKIIEAQQKRSRKYAYTPGAGPADAMPEFAIKLEPLPGKNQLGTLDKPVFRLRGDVLISKLVETVARRLHLDRSEVAIMCQGAVLPLSHELQFVKSVLWRNQAGDLVLQYARTSN